MFALRLDASACTVLVAVVGEARRPSAGCSTLGRRKDRAGRRTAPPAESVGNFYGLAGAGGFGDGCDYFEGLEPSRPLQIGCAAPRITFAKCGRCWSLIEPFRMAGRG